MKVLYKGLTNKRLYWLTFAFACLTVLIYLLTLATLNTDITLTLFSLILKFPLYHWASDRAHAFLYYNYLTQFAVSQGFSFFVISNLYLLNLYLNFILIFLLILPFREVKKDEFLLFFPMATYTFVYANSYIFPLPEEFLSYLLIWPCLLLTTGPLTNFRCLLLIAFSFFMSQTHEIALIFGVLLSFIIVFRLLKSFTKNWFQTITLIVSMLFFLSNIYWVYETHFETTTPRTLNLPIIQTVKVLFNTIYWPLWYTFVLIIFAAGIILKNQRWKNRLFLAIQKVIKAKIISLITLSCLFLIVFLWAINDIFMRSISTWELTWTFYSGALFVVLLIIFFIVYKFQIIELSEKTKKIFMLVTAIIAVCQTIQWSSYALRFDHYINQLMRSFPEGGLHDFPGEKKILKNPNSQFDLILRYPTDKLIVPILFQASKNKEIKSLIISNANGMDLSPFIYCLLNDRERFASMGIKIALPFKTVYLGADKKYKLGY